MVNSTLVINIVEDTEVENISTKVTCIRYLFLDILDMIMVFLFLGAMNFSWIHGFLRLILCRLLDLIRNFQTLAYRFRNPLHYDGFEPFVIQISIRSNLLDFDASTISIYILHQSDKRAYLSWDIVVNTFLQFWFLCRYFLIGSRTFLVLP